MVGIEYIQVLVYLASSWKLNALSVLCDASDSFEQRRKVVRLDCKIIEPYLNKSSFHYLLLLFSLSIFEEHTEALNTSPNPGEGSSLSIISLG